MDIAIGLPNAVPDTTGEQLTDWARAAEEAGFSTLGTIDRVAYGNFEPMTALTAAATVTERIGLATTVMLAPIRANAAMIAKQALSLDALAGGGRVMMGLAVGGREDDYEVSGFPMEKRGAWFDGALTELRKVLDGDGETEAKVGPRPSNGGPSLILGGSVDVTFERAARQVARLFRARRGRREQRRLLPARLLRLARQRDQRCDRGQRRHRRRDREGLHGGV